MLCDDTPLYPMTCHIRFWFDRAPARAAFETAFLGALKLHPLLSARLARSAFGVRKAFDLLPPGPATLPEILDWAPDKTELAVSRQHPSDLRVRILVRRAAPAGQGITASPDGRGIVVLVQFHHAITDGIGIFDFFEDLMLLYDRAAVGTERSAASDRPVSIPKRRTELLAGRGRFHMRPSDWWRRLPWDMARYRGFFLRLPAPLRLESTAPLSQGPAPIDAHARQVWSAERTKALADEAKSQGVTLNDLLLTRYFQALAAWQRQGDRASARGKTPGPLRVGVPTSLRLAEDAELPSTNVVSMVFLDRAGEILDQPQALLDSVATEMRRIKDQRLGLAMIRILTWFAWLPGLLKLFFRLPLCQTTSVLTNLGRPFANSPLMGDDGHLRSGDVTMTGVDTLPPVRLLTAISLSVNGYAGRLSLTLRYDGRLMSPATASRCLDLISRTFDGTQATHANEPLRQV